MYPMRAALIALLVLVAAACDNDNTNTSETTEQAAPSAPPSPTPAQTVEVASWDGDDLPPTIGGLSRRGDLGIYFAEVDHRIMLVAIDITTGRERWRQRVHQLGRVPGTVHTPTVDWDRGLVFAHRFEPDENPPLLGMFAYDLDGREQWRSGGVAGDARAVQLCGDDWICVSMPNGSVQRYHRDTGAMPLQSAGGGVGRVLGYFDPWLVTAHADEQLVELGRFTADGGYKRQWRRSFSELFEDKQAGATYTPNGGWYSDYNEDTNVTGVAFGAFAGEDPDTADLRREAEAGLAVSLVSDGGEVRASWQQVDLCLSDGWRDDAVVLCEDLEVVEDGRVIEGEPAPYFRAARVSSYDVADGRRQWTTALPGLVESIVPTTDETVFVVRPEGAEPLLLDVDDGSTVAPTERPELIVACERDYQDDDLFGELITSDGGPDRYRRATPDDVWQLCDVSGEVIEPAEHMATGALTPDWFGYHPGLDDDQEPEGADRWAVWVTPDGTLHGAGPAGDAQTTAR